MLGALAAVSGVLAFSDRARFLKTDAMEWTLLCSTTRGAIERKKPLSVPLLDTKLL